MHSGEDMHLIVSSHVERLLNHYSRLLTACEVDTLDSAKRENLELKININVIVHCCRVLAQVVADLTTNDLEATNLQHTANLEGLLDELNKSLTLLYNDGNSGQTED
eukprot:Platyproteum_vivax@DN5364_c0_g1_i1.p1